MSTIMNLTQNLLNNSANLNDTVYINASSASENINLYPFSLVVPFTIIYVIIFFTGIIGNVSTCVVIAKNKAMHTATNYYLFSLAVSDLVLLIAGLPPEMYKIWSPDTYVFGEAFCILQGFAAETSVNASILIITSFTIERYLAICHPFLSHTMSKLSRAVRYIIAIWIIALALAIPQASLFGIETDSKDGVQKSSCTVVKHFFEQAFVISTFVFFVGPMTLITILYVLIWIRLKKSKKITAHRVSTLSHTTSESGRKRMMRHSSAQNRVVKMLIAVVAAFFICWAPFHAQRLLAVYLSGAAEEVQQTFFNFYLYLMHTSGVLCFVSTTINPVLYHIMSRKFRKAFKNTFSNMCGCHKEPAIRHYTAISKLPPPMRNMQRSVSDGVTQINKDFLDYRTDRSGNTLKGKNRSNSKISQNSRISFFSNSSRSSSMYERNKSFLIHNKNSSGSPEHDKYFHYFPLKFFNVFNTPNNADLTVSESENTISNSSLKDTDVTEFNYSDLVNDMIQINENIS